MGQRFLTGLGIVAVLVLAIAMRFVSLYVFDALVGFIAICAVLEMSKLLAKMGKYNFDIIGSIHVILSYSLLLIGVILNIKLYKILIYQIVLLVGLFVLMFLFGIVFKKSTDNEIKTRKIRISTTKFALNKSLNTLIIMVYPTLLFMGMIFINHIGELANSISSDNLLNLSFILVVMLFTLPIFTDTFAYLTGNIFGGKKLCPKISPNKTISGAIGGFVWGVIGALCIFLIFNALSTYNNLFITFNLNVWHFAIVGAVSSVLCILGDLFESFLKRQASVKDSGEFFPGHGGVLDRLDSHLFNSFVIVIFALIILI